MSTQPGTRLYIPDNLADWPWRRVQNPAYARVKEVSSEWFRGFRAFDEESQRAFDLGDVSLLGALANPYADEQHLRSSCDFMHCVFLFDEYTDVADPNTAQKQAGIVMDALRNPHVPRPVGEFIGGEVHRQFWSLALQGATDTARRRFLDRYQEFVDSVVQEVRDRAANHVRDVESYFAVRRDTIAVKPFFVLLEFQMDIPDEVMTHPVVQDLVNCAVDMIIIENDICSYNVEQAQGNDLHNLVTIVMTQYDLDINSAMKWIADFHNSVADKFMLYRKRLPSWGPSIDSQMEIYVDGLGNCVRGNNAWCYESWRYFRGQGADVRRRGWIALMPKIEAAIAL